MKAVNGERAGDQGVAPGLGGVKTWSGEQKAWENIETLDSYDVCTRAGVSYDADSGLYGVRSFGAVLSVAPTRREISSVTPLGRRLLNTAEYFFSLSIVWYLVCARDIQLTGRLVKPVHMKGGQMFARGTHVLPLDELAEKYSEDLEGFLKKGALFGGTPGAHGDVSVCLPAFPRVPVYISLWSGDEEFPPRADLMFDSTAELQLPTDVVWSIASMSVLIMLNDSLSI
jgi:hypothetical protein